MRSLLKKINAILTKAEKIKLVALFFVATGEAIFEVFGVVSVSPFLSVLGNKEAINSNKYIKFVYDRLSFDDKDQFLIFLGASSIVILVVSAIFKIFSNYSIYKFVNMLRHDLSSRILQRTVRRPYQDFLDLHTSKVTSSIVSETDQVIFKVILPLLRIVAYSLIAIMMVTTLIVIDPVIAVVMAGTLGGCYYLIYSVSRSYLRRSGHKSVAVNKQRFKIITETMGGIKDLQVLGRENVYIESFRKPSLMYAKFAIKSMILGELPKFFVEAVAFSAIVALALYFYISQGAAIHYILPLLGIYAFAGYKMLPAMQHIYSSLSSMQFGLSSLENVTQFSKVRIRENSHSPEIEGVASTLAVQRTIRFDHIEFSYAKGLPPALDDISFEISKNTTVGIIGSTGSGKSTLIDVLLGLLRPQNGQILIDDVALNESNIKNWQANIGYVSQHIFLADDTIAKNIAFGISTEKIDLEQVQIAAKMAQIHDFIIALPNGYQTMIGERGVRLSGGQRQRLGIARALYHNPNILVLDEATSALDNQTEAEVMKSIDQLMGSKTIIIIAHRLSTVEHCHQVIRLEKGKIQTMGSFKEVVGLVEAKTLSISTVNQI